MRRIPSRRRRFFSHGSSCLRSQVCEGEEVFEPINMAALAPLQRVEFDPCGNTNYHRKGAFGQSRNKVGVLAKQSLLILCLLSLNQFTGMTSNATEMRGLLDLKGTVPW